MIYGIGSDLLDRRRIAKAYAMHPTRFPDKLLSPQERNSFSDSKHPVKYLAKRWAAKEAVSKALGTGIRHPVLFKAMTIERDQLGKPLFIADKPLSAWLNAQGIGTIHITLTDESHHIMAFAVAEHH